MDDARCHELFTVYKLPMKEIAQIVGSTHEGVRNAIWRHRNSAQKQLNTEKREQAKLFRESQIIRKLEIKERRLFDKEFPNAPPEWWAVWQVARKTKPSK